MELPTDICAHVCTHVHTYGIPRAGLVNAMLGGTEILGTSDGRGSVDGWNRGGEILCSLTNTRQ